LIKTKLIEKKLANVFGSAQVSSRRRRRRIRKTSFSQSLNVISQASSSLNKDE
jgi:hypothetical protein